MITDIIKLKGNKCNEINSSIEESSTNMNKEEDTCNTDNYNALKCPQIKNNTGENVGEINVPEKDKDKEDSREYKKSKCS